MWQLFACARAVNTPHLFMLVTKRHAKHVSDSLARMSLSFIFSPDSRELFECFLKNVARQSYNIRTSVAKLSDCKLAKFVATGLRHSHKHRTIVVQQSRDSLATDSRLFLAKKNSHEIFQHV